MAAYYYDPLVGCYVLPEYVTYNGRLYRGVFRDGGPGNPGATCTLYSLRGRGKKVVPANHVRESRTTDPAHQPRATWG